LPLLEHSTAADVTAVAVDDIAVADTHTVAADTEQVVDASARMVGAAYLPRSAAVAGWVGVTSAAAVEVVVGVPQVVAADSAAVAALRLVLIPYSIIDPITFKKVPFLLVFYPTFG
jgi:hypothetical protein